MDVVSYYYVMRKLKNPPIIIVDYLSLVSSLYLSFDCVIIIIEILQLGMKMATVGKIKEFNPQTVIFNIRGSSSALFRSERSEQGQESSYVLDGHWPKELLDHK